MSSHRTLKKIKNKLGCSYTKAQAVVCQEKRNCQKHKTRQKYTRRESRYYDTEDIERLFNG